jgi:hypothetical protein
LACRQDPGSGTNLWTNGSSIGAQQEREQVRKDWWKSTTEEKVWQGMTKTQINDWDQDKQMKISEENWRNPNRSARV